MKTTGMGTGMGSEYGPCPTPDGPGYILARDGRRRAGFEWVKSPDRRQISALAAISSRCDRTR